MAVGMVQLRNAPVDVLLTLALMEGVLLALVLVAFLFSWRTTLISLVTIHLSLVVAALALYLLGEKFDPIAFAGLAVAIPLIIDDAVAGIHNVLRRLRQHRREVSDGSTADVVVAAFAEVRRPTTYAVFIALLAIVPVVAMGGGRGAYFEPLALSYALAVLASMVVALTVAPALSLLVFSRGSVVPREAPIVRLLTRGYDGALSPPVS